MLTGLIAASIALSQPITTTLFRGAEIPGESIRYWGVEDTTLDASQPNTAFGGRGFLQGGPGKRILIRFSDLRRALGPNRKITQARLVLSAAAGERMAFRSASKILAPWNEGPAQVVNFANVALSSEGDGPLWSATFRSRRAGVAPWQNPGASGPADQTPAPSAKWTKVSDTEFELSGIEDVVRAEYESGVPLGGVSLAFDEPFEFYSSQAVRGKPRLIVTTEATSAPATADLAVVSILPTGGGQADSYTVTVRNVGASPATGFSLRWAVGERWGSFAEFNRTLAPGESMSTTYQATIKSSSDPRTAPIAVEIRPSQPDAEPSNNALEVGVSATQISAIAPPGADPLRVESTLIDLTKFLNAFGFPQSRFSFAPDGVVARLAPAGLASNGVLIDPSAPMATNLARILERLGVSATPSGSFIDTTGGERRTFSSLGVSQGFVGLETRFDGSIPALVDLSPEPIDQDLLRVIQVEGTDLLGMVPVARLNQGASVATKVPSSIILRLADTQGRPLEGATLEFFAGLEPTGTPVIALTATATGIANLQGANLDKELYLLRARFKGQTEYGFLHRERLVALGLRSSVGAALVELRFNFGAGATDSTNLAKGRIATDAAGTLPARLVALTDDANDTAAEFSGKEGDWVEVDLGRDRLIGEIRIAVGAKSDLWKSFQIRAYGTGQTLQDAVVWANESSSTWRFENQYVDKGAVRELVYRGAPQRFRYIRIVPRTEAVRASIREVRAFGIKSPS